jgi:predicted anti-sigma-YlaC factor YlaD
MPGSGGAEVRTEHRVVITEQVQQARKVGRVLRWLGWSLICLGVVGIGAFSVLWAIGDVDAEQALGLILGTALASILSGAAAYGSGVNVGLGAERLNLAAAAADHPPPTHNRR